MVVKYLSKRSVCGLVWVVSVDIFEVMCCVLITDYMFSVNSVLKDGLFVIGDNYRFISCNDYDEINVC